MTPNEEAAILDMIQRWERLSENYHDQAAEGKTPYVRGFSGGKCGAYARVARELREMMLPFM